jgi:hypothetical protein
VKEAVISMPVFGNWLLIGKPVAGKCDAHEYFALSTGQQVGGVDGPG